MSLLAPLYIAGALAIALPVIFHLIRRRPQGRQPFSSLMFLTASPPRITKRSRLENILLLILRATALALLALAFARPFFTQHANAQHDASQGRQIALLVDTSASMRRGDLWQQAIRQVENVLADSSPADHVSLLLFDRHVQPAVSFAQWNDSPPSMRHSMLRARLAEAAPTWRGTNLGDALINAADMLAESASANRAADSMKRELVVISDLQQGGGVESLQAHEWPENVVLDVRPVALQQSTNASVQLVKESELTDGKLRVRISNQPDSTAEQFSIAWANSAGALPATQPVAVYVAPGRSQTLVLDWPTDPQADRLVLHGDDFDFDNTHYVVRPRQAVIRVVYLGNDKPDDPQRPLYYLQNALTETPQFKADFVIRQAGDALLETDLADAPLVVVAVALSPHHIAPLREFLQQGGQMLWVLTDAATADGLPQLAQVDTLAVDEGAVRDYSLLGEVDFAHHLFAPFADARFGDFTNIHFWKHRRMRVPDGSGFERLASFDNGDPFLLQKSVGRGTLLVMTSGWHPADSQLALSTKFVPLINGLVAREQNRDAALSNVPDEPGVHEISSDAGPVAVNVPADESRTTPLSPQDLARWGAKLHADPTPQDQAARQQQMQAFELENRQKLWRWLIVAVLGLLAGETFLAGRLARRDSLRVPA